MMKAFRTRRWLAAILVLAGTLHGQEQPPARYGITLNYDEAKVLPYTLPDPLVCLDGSAVPDAATWKSKRRPEVLSVFRSQMYGRVPEIGAVPTFEVVSQDATAL